jgi:hypothetical protein
MRQAKAQDMKDKFGKLRDEQDQDSKNVTIKCE